MLANNLDLINLAILEREELLRRHGRAFTIGSDEANTPWNALRARISRFFSLLGGSAVEGDHDAIVADADASVLPESQPRPHSLTVIHLPASVTDEAIDRAA